MLPRPTIDLTIQLPGGKQGQDSRMHASVSQQLLEDICIWMGWPDEALRPNGHALKKDPSSGALWLVVRSSLSSLWPRM